LILFANSSLKSAARTKVPLASLALCHIGCMRASRRFSKKRDATAIELSMRSHREGPEQSSAWEVQRGDRCATDPSGAKSAASRKVCDHHIVPISEQLDSVGRYSRSDFDAISMLILFDPGNVARELIRTFGLRREPSNSTW
jgi:hypothetical protein